MATTNWAASPQPIDDFDAWISAFTKTSVLSELAVLATCAIGAWATVAALRRSMGLRDQRSIWFGTKNLDGVLFPLILLCLAYAGLAILKRFMSVAVLKVAIPVLVALVAIRIGVHVLRAAFVQSRWVRALEQTVSWLVWLSMVLWVSGLLPVVLNELDQISWKVGGSVLTVRNIVEGLVTAAVVLIFTLWISAAIETRLLKSAEGDELSLRKALSNATRGLLMFLGLILALSAVGIDLTALSVLGGAAGVGIGLGLQRLAANYVSGFVILAERSMRIGDTVRVDNFEGEITQINARYTVVRSLAGRESIVPNEMLISNRVENLSLVDSKVAQSTVVNVAYDSNVDLVQTLLVGAALAQERVLRDPEPAAQLSAFGTDGLEFSLWYWVDDIERGQGNLRSDINLAILKALRDHQIEVPYPQRVVHQR